MSNSAVLTELSAVNYILNAIGQASVSTLDLKNPEVYAALETLRAVNKEVQSEGWYFNTEHYVKFTGDSNNEIILQNDILQIDANKNIHRDDYALIRKNGKLYDKYHHLYTNRDEFKFPNPIYCDVVYLYSFEDIPSAFKEHIIAKAARKVSTKLIGNTDLARVLAVDEEQTKAAMMEYETRQGDYSIFGWGDNQNRYSSYQPFKALAR